MDNKEDVVKLWDGNSPSGNPPLRRPNQNANSRPQSSNGGQQQAASRQQQDHAADQAAGEDVDLSILNTTTLSVDAKEWFPPNYSAAAPAAAVVSVQSRLERIRLNEQGGPQHPPAAVNGNAEINGVGMNPDEDTHKLKEIVTMLTYDPGRFDDAVSTFLSILQPYTDDIEVSNSTADLLFETVRK